MCVGFMMIGCLFILLKKATLIKWRVSRPLTFFFSFPEMTHRSWKQKANFYLHHRKACCFKILRKNTFTVLLFTFTVPEECKHQTCHVNIWMNRSHKFGAGQSVFFWTNGKFIKHSLFENVCLAPRKLHTLHLPFQFSFSFLLPHIQTWTTVLWALIWHHDINPGATHLVPGLNMCKCKWELKVSSRQDFQQISLCSSHKAIVLKRFRT